MANFIVTTTGTVPTVVFPELDLTLTHPQTIDLVVDEKFALSDITDAISIQDAVDAGEVTITDGSVPITNVTFIKISTAASSGLTDTDDLPEGSTNLYFTDVRARVAAIVNSTVGNETDQAASVDAVKNYIASELTALETQIKNDIIGGAAAAYDTLLEIQNELQGNDSDIAGILTTLGNKLDASAVSTFGLSLIDDADAATARTTLGLGSAATSNSVDFATSSQGALADTAVQPGDLATVATTGDYNDLVNLPTPNVYGTEFNLFEDNVVSTTTSTTFQTKISGNTTSLVVGKYKITISYNWNHDSTQSDFETLFLFDGSALGADGGGIIHEQEPKDSAGTFSTTGSSQKYAYTKVLYTDVTVAGIKPVLLQYRTDNASNESSIWDANIEIIRVQ